MRWEAQSLECLQQIDQIFHLLWRYSNLDACAARPRKIDPLIRLTSLH
jgi:hypothetical protein